MELIVTDFLLKHAFYLDELRSRYNISYIKEINENQKRDAVRSLIQIDVKQQRYKFVYYLRELFISTYKYVVLDDFYKCDEESYEWLLRFSENYTKGKGYFILLCDFNTCWESKKVYEIASTVQELIDIQCFDNKDDYFYVLKQYIFFDNFEELKEIAYELFGIYKGNAQLLFKTLKLYGKDVDNNDGDRKKRLLMIANNLTLNALKSNKKVEKLVLELLTLSQTPLSLMEISKTLEISEDLIQEIIFNHINNELIDMGTVEGNNNVSYCISDSLICKLILQNINDKSKDFILNRIWIMVKSDVIHISSRHLLELALEIKSCEAEKILNSYLYDNANAVTKENRIYYIDCLYSLNLQSEHIFSTYNNAEMAYEYGYFDTALKMLIFLKDVIEPDYSFFMLLGGTQHLLLRAEAPQTFDKAANFSNITLSQKLSALNRKIMSLNQGDEKSASEAKQLYDSLLNQYKHEKCDGLIELYRNTNNSYPMDTALAYTKRGYQLAVELGNELEKYKCIHNICMINLHQNQYSQSANLKDLNNEFTFDIVDQFFEKNPLHFHKRAYPLLNLGTYEMMKYISTKDKQHLKEAKFYYSKAQLFAKSFYARHIAEMALLVTNTHLYRNETTMVNSIGLKRKDILEKYNEEYIVDHRANRKILLSLAVSSVLTQDYMEARTYLKLAEPYISGPETARYRNLKEMSESINYNHSNNDANLYYGSPDFVPWLISFGH